MVNQTPGGDADETKSNSTNPAKWENFAISTISGLLIFILTESLAGTLTAVVSAVVMGIVVAFTITLSQRVQSFVAAWLLRPLQTGGWKIVVPLVVIFALGGGIGWQIKNFLTSEATDTPEATPVTTPLVKVVYQEPTLGNPVSLQSWAAYIQGPQDSDLTPIVGTAIVDGWNTDVMSVTDVYLESEQVQDSELRRNLIFEWKNPLEDVPYSGIMARVRVEPNSDDEDAVVLCQFETEYELKDSRFSRYQGIAHWVPYGEWTTIVWDFTGLFWLTPGDEHYQEWDALMKALNDEHSYVISARRLGEKMFDDALEERGLRNSDWQGRMSTIRVKCFLPAKSPFTEEQFVDFNGTVSLSTVRVLPVDYTKVP